MLLGTDGRTQGNRTELCMWGGGSGRSKEKAFLWGGSQTAELCDALHRSVTAPSDVL